MDDLPLWKQAAIEDKARLSRRRKPQRQLEILPNGYRLVKITANRWEAYNPTTQVVILGCSKRNVMTQLENLS